MPRFPFILLLTGFFAVSAAALDPPAGDSLISETNVRAWYALGDTMPPLREGNDVVGLIGGQETFTSMRAEMARATTDQHFVYLLNWWMTDGFKTDPGDDNSTFLKALQRANKDSVEIRAMLWDQWGSQNDAEVRRIRALKKGAAILDNRTLNYGSHHQKILVVKGNAGLVGFCGGIDVNPDRVYRKANDTPNKKGDTGGSPFQDIQCLIRGPAAGDLLKIFVERWKEHPSVKALAPGKQALLGDPVQIPPSIVGKTNWVQIGRTYPDGSKHAGIAKKKIDDSTYVNAGYKFAEQGERTAARMIVKGIRQATETIYVEDQYFVDTASNDKVISVLDALKVTLQKPTFKHLIVLIPHSAHVSKASLFGFESRLQYPYRRQQFITALKAVGGAKVQVFNLVNARADSVGDTTYVHSKTWIFDDQYAIIGSANCNRRSFTHDSEVVAGIVDQGRAAADTLWFPHDLRMRLWSKHLNVPKDQVKSFLNSVGLWSAPPPGARIMPYNQNVNVDAENPDEFWNKTVDPDGS